MENKKKTKLGKRIKQRLILWLVPVPVYLISRLLFASLRKKLIGFEKFLECWNSGQPIILVFWHNRVIIGAPFYLWIRRIPIMALVSESFDGYLASRIFRLYRADVTLGSSTRGGEKGLRSMIDFGKKGYSLALTPDGPRGPVYKMKPGVVKIAKETGLPIFAIAWYASKVTRFNSWDSCIFPHPFSKVVFMSADPIYVPQDADDEMIKSKCDEVESVLNRLSSLTEEYFSEEKNSVS